MLQKEPFFWGGGGDEANLARASQDMQSHPFWSRKISVGVKGKPTVVFLCGLLRELCRKLLELLGLQTILAKIDRGLTSSESG